MRPTCLDSSYERFCESVFTQQDSITAIEKFDNKTFVSTSKDGSLAVWKFLQEGAPQIDQEKVIELVCHQVPEVGGKSSKKSALTSAKWMDQDNIIVGMKSGHLVKFAVGEKKTEVI